MSGFFTGTAKVRCCYACGNPIIGSCLVTAKGDAHHSCVHTVSSEDTIAHLTAELERCREALRIGRQLANVAYNIGQRGYADAGAIRSLVAAQIEFDTARAALNKEPPHA